MNSIIPKGSIIASFVYEKSSNLDGYEDMDKKTLEEVKKIDGYLGHEVFGDGHRNIFLSYWRGSETRFAHCFFLKDSSLMIKNRLISSP